MKPLDVVRPLGISIQDAAVIAGVSRRTIYNWLNAERLVFCRTVTGHVRIDPESLKQAEQTWKRTRR